MIREAMIWNFGDALGAEVDDSESVATGLWLVIPGESYEEDDEYDTAMAVLGCRTPEDAARSGAARAKADGRQLPEYWQVHPLRTGHRTFCPKRLGALDFPMFHDAFIQVRL